MTEDIDPSVPSSPASPEGAPEKPPGISFVDLGLRPEVLRALADMGFAEPMEVQAKTVPLINERRDLMVQSRTGSGKTAAFGIPLVDRIVDPAEKNVQAIVLLPTRELALQVAAELARVATHSALAVVPIYGGAPMGRQIEQLRAGAHIVCGTPGRVLDHLRRGTLKLDGVKCAVLDECDEMLSMGFQEDIESILELTPATRQTLLFSATVPEGIQRLARRFMRDPVDVKLSTDFVGVYEVRHVYYMVQGGLREQDLLRVIEFENPERGIIFCNTREETGRVAEFLRKVGIQAEAISSDLAQSDRERVMGRMRAGELRFLVATDVAARGIDLENLSHVFNFSFPESPEVYIHRTGRTGRAGKHGTAISLIGPTEVGALYYVKLLYKIKPEERSLPSETEIRSRREGEQILALRAELPEDPGAAWRSLARRLMVALDAERLVGALLARVLGDARARPASAATPVEAARAASDDAREPEAAAPYRERDRDRDRERGDRWRDRDRPRDRSGASGASEPDRFSVRNQSGAGSEPDRFSARNRSGAGAGRDADRFSVRNQDRPRDFEDRDRGERRPRSGEFGESRDRGRRRSGASGASEPDRFSVRKFRDEGWGRSGPPAESRRRGPDEGSAPPPREPRPDETSAPREERPPSEPGTEFWDVWKEAPPEAAGAEPPPPSATARPRAEESAGDEASPQVAPGTTRIFLNLGRKDRATLEDVIALLGEGGVTLPAGDIDLMNTHSYFNVPSEKADDLCRALTGRDHNGRKLICELARPKRR